MNKKLWLVLAATAMLTSMPLRADQRDLDAVVVPNVDAYGVVDIAGIRTSPFIQALPKEQNDPNANAVKPLDDFFKQLGLKKEDIEKVLFSVSLKRLDPDKPVSPEDIDLVVAISLARPLSYEKLRGMLAEESKKDDTSVFVTMDFGRLPGFRLCEGKNGKPNKKSGDGIYLTQSWDGKVVFFTLSKSTMISLANRCAMGKDAPVALPAELSAPLEPLQLAQFKLGVVLTSELREKLTKLVEKQNGPPPPDPAAVVPGTTAPGGPGVAPGGPGVAPGGPGAVSGGGSGSTPPPGPGGRPGGPGAVSGGSGSTPPPGPGGRPGGPGADPGGSGSTPPPGPGGRPGGPGAGPGGPGAGPGGPGAGPGGPGAGPGGPGAGPGGPGAGPGGGTEVTEVKEVSPVEQALAPYKDAKQLVIGLLFKQNMNLRIVIGFNEQRNAVLAMQQIQGYLGILQMMAGQEGGKQTPQSQAAIEIVKGITAKNPTPGVMQLSLMVTGKQAEALSAAVSQGVMAGLVKAKQKAEESNAKSKKPKPEEPAEKPKLEPMPGGALPPPAKPTHPAELKPTPPAPPAINNPNKPQVGANKPTAPEVGFGKPKQGVQTPPR